MQILFVNKNIPDRDWLSRFAEGNPVKTDSFLFYSMFDVHLLTFPSAFSLLPDFNDVHQLSFSLPIHQKI
jgi:hypothetical protein